MNIIPTPRGATIYISASNSTKKLRSDLVCTGTADQVLINSTIAAAPAGSHLIFRTGTYVLTDEIDVGVGRLVLYLWASGSVVEGI